MDPVFALLDIRSQSEILNIQSGKALWSSIVNRPDSNIRCSLLHGSDKMIRLSKVTGKGKVTIPVEFRKDLGIAIGDTILFEKKNGRTIIRKAEKKSMVEVLEDSTPFSRSTMKIMKKIRDEWD